MDLYIQTNKSYLNKKILSISLLIGLFVNLIFLFFFEFYISRTPRLKVEEVKVKYVKIPEPVKKKEIKKKEKNISNIKKKKATKPQGEKISKTPLVPIAIPVLPEVETLPDKEVELPEKEVDIGNFSDITGETGDIKEFKALTLGEFNPEFGTELSKFDKSAQGTAIGRKLIFKPKPPVIKAKVPPPPIKVKLWINKDGTVSKVMLLGTTGNKKIDQLIKKYVQSWKFNEIDKDVQQWAITTIRFKISF